MNKQKTNGWKVTAIIFIFLFVLENIAIIGVLIWAQGDIDKENECIYNVCADYEAYIYYDFEKLCECYDDGVLTHREYINE
jgi:hypothetical protein